MRRLIKCLVTAAIGMAAVGCADTVTKPEAPVGTFSLVAIADSNGTLHDLPASVLVSPYESLTVFSATFSILPGNKWLSRDTNAVGFAGAWGPRYEQVYSGNYQYSAVRDSLGRSAGLLVLDPFSIQYAPALLIGDSLFWGSYTYVRP